MTQINLILMRNKNKRNQHHLILILFLLKKHNHNMIKIVESHLMIPLFKSKQSHRKALFSKAFNQNQTLNHKFKIVFKEIKC